MKQPKDKGKVRHGALVPWGGAWTPPPKVKESICKACGIRPCSNKTSKSGKRCTWCAEYGAPIKEDAKK